MILNPGLKCFLSCIVYMLFFFFDNPLDLSIVSEYPITFTIMT